MNLYNFHKVKNMQNYIEFAHDQFRRNNIEEFQYITRKIHTDNNDYSRFRAKEQKPMAHEYTKLYGIIRNLEESLKTANKKNSILETKQEDLLKQFERTKREHVKRSKKLLFIIWLVTQNLDEALLNKIRQLFSHQQVEMNYQLFDTKDAFNLPKIFDEQNLFAVSDSNFLIERLLKVVVEYHNAKPKNRSKVDVDELLLNMESDDSTAYNYGASHTGLSVKESEYSSDIYNKSSELEKQYPSVYRYAGDSHSPRSSKKDKQETQSMRSSMEIEESDWEGLTINEMFSKKRGNVFHF